ncbi:HAD family hydrolase [Ornithinimicrobium panacihumi]|uniref:HAD family hydrolase n=1 Tax=Ornithinimicrobium panacihumi TaxID=2008449 RepID=UPI003F8CCD85
MNSSQPSLVATDCDGTLLRSDGTVSERTRAVLSALSDTGIGVILVTARPPRWMNDLADLGVGDIALCGNGAFTYDLRAREIVDHTLIPAEELALLIDDLRKAIPDIRLATEGLEGMAREHAYRGEHLSGDAWQVTDVPGLSARAVGKLLVRHDVLHTEELTELVTAVVGERAAVSHSGATRLTEIGPAGMSKAVALAHWCSQQDPEVRPEEVWAFGDMPNDLPMLDWAGRSFAVANAHPEVLAAATDLIPGNDDDGVARTLEALLG